MTDFGNRFHLAYELVALVEEHGGRLDEHMLIALMSLITAMPEYQLC